MDGKKTRISSVVKRTISWESDERKVPRLLGKAGTNFPGSPTSVDFAAFYNAMGS